jgi:hypothetical protein
LEDSELRCERLLALSGDQFVDEDPEDLDEFNEDVLRELVRKYRTDAPVKLELKKRALQLVGFLKL